MVTWFDTGFLLGISSLRKVAVPNLRRALAKDLTATAARLETGV
jgi:hypothetical protein